MYIYTYPTHPYNKTTGAAVQRHKPSSYYDFKSYQPFNNSQLSYQVLPLYGMKTLASLLEDSNSGEPGRDSLSSGDVNDTNNNEHRCGECGRVCDSAQQLAFHLQSGECLACGVCGKRFSQRVQWAAHQRQHEEARQEHPCTHCAKSFGTRASLKVQQLCHKVPS